MFLWQNLKHLWNEGVSYSSDVCGHYGEEEVYINNDMSLLDKYLEHLKYKYFSDCEVADLKLLCLTLYFYYQTYGMLQLSFRRLQNG